MTSEEIIRQSHSNQVSLFQLLHFVVRKEPTVQAQLKRCADELALRQRSLQAARLELEESSDNMRLLEADLEDYSGPHGRRQEIIRRQIERKLQAARARHQEIEDRLQTLERESQFFTDTYNDICQFETPQNWDSEAVQTEYWSAKLGIEIQRRLLLQLPMDLELINTALALPDSAPIKKELLDVLKRQQKAIENQYKAMQKQDRLTSDTERP